jgi:hypothetical protein
MWGALRPIPEIARCGVAFLLLGKMARAGDLAHGPRGQSSFTRMYAAVILSNIQAPQTPELQARCGSAGSSPQPLSASYSPRTALN